MANEKHRYTSVLIPDGESHLLRLVINCLAINNDIQIYVMTNKKISEMRFSRYVYKYIYVSKKHDEFQWINSINDIVKKYNIDLVVPIFEAGIQKMIENKKFLDCPKKICLLPSYESLTIAGDKGLLYKHLKKLKLPCTKSIIVQAGDSLPVLPSDFSFPMLVKPVKGFGGGMGINKFASEKELVAYFERSNFQYDHIVQSYIKGYDICCNVLCNQGSILAYTIQKDSFLKNGEFSPQISIDFVEEDELITTSKQLIKSLNWSGIANIDFRFNESDNSFKVLEINPRFWVNTEASVLAGVNFPNLLCLASLNRKVEIQKARLISCLNLKGLARQISINPMFAFRVKYIINNTPFKFAVKDPLPMIYKYALRIKNLIIGSKTSY
ncbi:ATP-grasp domain-containing protein [Flavivirga spongiicola]|uniref:ATP-grasp domain-containing protein n=1 Tax=Flavivirga spongiicola TaxID=421621 RepID=A0ABU7XYD7_9FLAO|nr:ATP-grasp domain-containing protein [Flavivirga sp. MEBiC05379]MDO5980420.1 ATP-grasp domain-containing protein [Flavivirga sp. MEBiC05379]